MHVIKNTFLYTSIVLLLNLALIGCVPEHDVIIVNPSTTTYKVEILYPDGQSRIKTMVRADGVARIKRAVHKAAKEKFIFRFESKEKKKEMILTWQELLAREWIIPLCD